MIVIQFLENLLHDRFSVKCGTGTHPELLAELVDCSHFAVVKIYDLPMAAYHRCFLFLEIIRIYRHRFLLLCHDDSFT